VGPGANGRSNRFVFDFIVVAITVTVMVARRTVGPAFAVAISAEAFAVARPGTIAARGTALTKFSRRAVVAAEIGATTTERRAHRLVLVNELRHLLELFATQRIVLVGIELLKHFFGRGKRGAAGATRAVWSEIAARSSFISGSATIAGTLPVSRAGTSLAIFLALPELLTHRIAHLLALVVTELAVAILVEFFDHSIVHGLFCSFALVIAELAIAVLIMFFEHPFVHLALGRAVGFVAVFRLIRYRRSGQQSEGENQDWSQVSHFTHLFAGISENSAPRTARRFVRRSGASKTMNP
jgi:hypothetical protein